jgi:hypothetical protein
MLSPESRDHAAVLRVLLNDGELRRADPVSIGDGVLPLELAAKIALAEIGHLDWLTEHGRDLAPERWHRLAGELAPLHDLAVTPA